MAKAPFLALITPLTGDAHPEHPIVLPPGLPGQPPGFWGPNDPRPSNPIANVPGAPGYSPGSPPLGTWGGANEPFPTPPINLPAWPPAHPEHPIVIPPEVPPGETPPTGPLGKMSWQSAWTEEYGWAVVGVQQGPHVTPSKK